MHDGRNERPSMISAAIAFTILFWAARTVVRAAEEARNGREPVRDARTAVPPEDETLGEDDSGGEEATAVDLELDLFDLEPEPPVELPEDDIHVQIVGPSTPEILITEDRRLDDVLSSGAEPTDSPRHAALKLAVMIALLGLGMGAAAWLVVRGTAALFNGLTGS